MEKRLRSRCSTLDFGIQKTYKQLLKYIPFPERLFCYVQIHVCKYMCMYCRRFLSQSKHQKQKNGEIIQEDGESTCDYFGQRQICLTVVSIHEYVCINICIYTHRYINKYIYRCFVFNYIKKETYNPDRNIFLFDDDDNEDYCFFEVVVQMFPVD